ncbi:MAG TPA: ABC transporter ATP-binding protein [Candidatus Eisenbacteria bacterium]
MASLTLEALTLTYPNGTRAVDGIDLAIDDGSFLAILGPSGCGKSSLLRLVAGLESPTSGTIAMDGRDVTRLEPKDRDVAMVFQGLALYPHMTVAENLSLGLRARKTPTAEIDRRVRDAAATLDLTRHLAKRPRELSGGERQRVALGRALVRSPRIFLFDEPLSSLDAQLRQELREELARLHRLTRATSIYVTHDQKEALSLGDRVAVMRDGRVRQLATPEAIYHDPGDLFVARFVGEPAINLIEGEVGPGPNGAGAAVFRAPGLALALQGAGPRAAAPRPGPATLGVRPETARLAGPQAVPAAGGGADGAAVGDARGALERVERLGGETLLHVRGEFGTIVVRLASDVPAPEPGASVALHFDPARAVLFDPRTGARLW